MDMLKCVNDWADFWRDAIGVNVIPADTRNKSIYIKWSAWQDNPIPEDQHNQWKLKNDFSSGIAIIPGKVWHNEQKKDLYLTFVDIDKSIAIEEFCTRDGKTIFLQELSEKFLVEQHKDNLEKAHVYFYSPIPFVKKSSDAVTGLEVKGLGEHGIAYCSPSIHKDGQPYEIIGTTHPITLTAVEAKELMQHIDNICKKYGVEYLDKHYSNLLDSDSKIYQGSRHDSLISIANRILFRYCGGNEINKGKLEELKSTFVNINEQRCDPPLTIREVDSIWKDAVAYYKKIKDQEKEKQQTKESCEEQQSHADILVQLAIDNTKLFFQDQYGVAFALIRVNTDDSDHTEVIKLESNRFRRYLSKLFYDNQRGRVVNSDAISNAVQVLHAQTEYDNHTIPLSLRIACKKQEGDDLTFYYDLTDPKWQYIKITKHQWDLVDNNTDDNSQIFFVRYNQTPQVLPERNYEPDIFDKFLALTNVADEQNKLLLKVYIVTLFVPEISHSMLILHGEKGSAKSTLQLLIKLLVDPAKPSLLTVHKDRTEFVQQLNHNYIAFYDNVKHVPYWLSDEACKAVTGVGQTKRKLYTDDDDIVYEFKRCLGFNGINVSLTEPDALDRSILIELSRIAKENRRVESEITADFIELKPRLLGYIFDILVKTLELKPTIKLLDLPRMADFASWGETISQAMGYEPLRFINAYYENIGKQNIEAIEAHPLGQLIAKYFEDGNDFGKDLKVLEGSPSEILDILATFAEQHRLNTNHKLWPKSVNVLSRRLNQIRSNLLEGLGINVTISRIANKSRGKINTSYIKMWKIPPICPIPPIDQNYEENSQKTAGDISRVGDIESPAGEIPPVEYDLNHAQKSAIGGTGDFGDILLTSTEDDTRLAENIKNIAATKQQSRFECYYCKVFHTNIKEDYERHVISDHPGKLCYPSRADLARLGLEPKGKDWEI
jgi:hypothetical protein